MAEFDLVSGIEGEGDIKVSDCFGCPLAITLASEYGYVDGYECGFEGVQASAWDKPPPANCPLRRGHVVVRLRTIGGET